MSYCSATALAGLEAILFNPEFPIFWIVKHFVDSTPKQEHSGSGFSSSASARYQDAAPPNLKNREVKFTPQHDLDNKSPPIYTSLQDMTKVIDPHMVLTYCSSLLNQFVTLINLKVGISSTANLRQQLILLCHIIENLKIELDTKHPNRLNQFPQINYPISCPSVAIMSKIVQSFETIFIRLAFKIQAIYEFNKHIFDYINSRFNCSYKKEQLSKFHALILSGNSNAIIVDYYRLQHDEKFTSAHFSASHALQLLNRFEPMLKDLRTN